MGKSTDLSVIPTLDWIKLIGTILMVISLPFSESLKTISMFLILLVFLVQLFKREIKLDMSTVHCGLIFLLVSALISSAFADNPAKSLKGAKDIFFYTIPFFVAWSIKSEKHIRITLWSFYLSTALAALYGIYHSIEINKPLEIHSLGNQNYTAMYLIIVMISMISTIIFSDRETKSSKLIISALAFLTTVAAVMTAMRSSFLGLFLFLIILFFGYKHLKTARLFSLILLGLIGVFICLYEPMRLKFFTATSLISRFYIWEHALNLFKENLIIGIGLNHFKYAFPPNTIEAGASYFDAHSLYFQTASQMGLLGLLSISMIVFGFLYRWVRLRGISAFQKCLKYGALGGFFVTFIGGILDTTLHHEHAIAFTFLTGLLFGYASQGESREQKTQEA